MPPRQIGIAGRATRDDGLLRALALLLSSDFATYHQFFDSPQEGAFGTVASTLASLRRMPTPFLEIEREGTICLDRAACAAFVEQSNAAQRDVLDSPRSCKCDARARARD
jgi:hypothetical protein